MQAARGTPLNSSESDSSGFASGSRSSADDDAQNRPDVRSGSPATVRARRVLTFVVAVLVVYACDLASKLWAVAVLQDQPAVTVIPGILNLTFLRNPGAAFGMGTGFTAVLSIAAVGISVVVAALAHRLRDRTWALTLGLLLAGALGNLTDRVFREPGFMRGHVVDFLQLPNWPVFNVADVAITAAAVLVVVQSLRGVSLDGSRQPDTPAGKDPPP